MSPTRPIERSPAIGLVATGAVSVQFGAAIAAKLFSRIGPAGAATWRIVLAAAVLLAGRALWGAKRRPARGDWAVAVGFGVVLAAMNLSFYEALDRIPLGVTVTIEFSGPLAVALAGSRRWTDGLWAAGAAAGVALLATGLGRHLDPAGVGFAVLAGLFWAAYILLSREAGRRFDSLDGLVIAMTAGGVVLLPVGLAAGGRAMFLPSVIGIALSVAVLSSLIPYSLELLALRKITPRAFGVMMSLDPAVAAAAGFLVLGQHLTGREWAALALVVGANLGNSLASRAAAVTPAPGSL